MTGLHWNSRGDQYALLDRLAELRAEHLPILRKEICHPLEILHPTVSGLVYWDGQANRGLLLVINGDPLRPYVGQLNLGYHTWRGTHRLLRHFRNHVTVREYSETGDGMITLTLSAGECTVYSLA